MVIISQYILKLKLNLYLSPLGERYFHIMMRQEILSETLYDPQIGDRVRAYDFSFMNSKDNKDYNKPFQYFGESYYEGILVEANVYSPERCCRRHYKILADKRVFGGKEKLTNGEVIEVFPPMNGNRDLGGLNNGVQPI